MYMISIDFIHVDGRYIHCKECVNCILMYKAFKSNIDNFTVKLKIFKPINVGVKMFLSGRKSSIVANETIM